MLLAYWIVKCFVLLMMQNNQPNLVSDNPTDCVENNSFYNWKTSFVVMLLLIIAFAVFLFHDYKCEEKCSKQNYSNEKVYLFCFVMHSLNTCGMFILILLSNYWVLCNTLNHFLYIVVILQITILRNEAISDLLLIFEAIEMIIITLLKNGTIVSIELFESIIWWMLAKFVIHTFEAYSEEWKRKRVERNQFMAYLHHILDHIPSCILFWTNQGITKVNKWWVQMKDKLSASPYYKSKKEECLLDSSDSFDDESSFELLQNFKWVKNKNLSLKDVVWSIVGKKESSLNINIHDAFNVFNMIKKSHKYDSENKTLKYLSENVENIKEVTVNCNLFTPWREFNAYICKMPQENFENNSFNMSRR